MNFSIHHPAKVLAPYVSCIWVLEMENEITKVSDFDKVFPDGSPELVFTILGSFTCRNNGIVNKQSHAILFGQTSRFIELKPSGDIVTIGVKFKPNGLAYFTAITQNELASNYFEAKDIFPKFDNNIVEKLSCATSLRMKINLIEGVLVEILSKRNISFLKKMSAIDYALSRLQESNGSIKVNEIAKQLSVSTRELERKFNNDVGITPKQLSRIYRFQYALTLKGKYSTLADLSFHAGYYDQSHFIREFKNIGGNTPGSLLSPAAALTDAFIENR
jgi:AraC-like DNA-binding protein